ncbi:MAG TPA: hypothetical protein VHZ75_04665 [Solirubrobacteraceae bacterium]|jgi:hypothetical protein|nr:hypothetical protein [Solirubrobacteraceae bacterium]
MRRFLPILALLAICLAPASVAQAQLSPQLPSQLTQPPPPPPAKPQKFDDGGLSTLQVVLIFGSASFVLAAIAFIIVRDARRRAPVSDRPRKASAGGAAGTGAAAAGESASAIRARERQRAKRAKAKAKSARDQRKRNRPR